jgi:hypothetical protein
LNQRIILSHRSRLTDLADAVESAKAMLLDKGGEVADIREAAVLLKAWI